MIDIEHRIGEFRFLARYNGEHAGIMTYIAPYEDSIVINHTYVLPKFKGKGIGKQLALSGVEFARKEGKKIIPDCSFIKDFLESKEEFKDVLK